MNFSYFPSLVGDAGSNVYPVDSTANRFRVHIMVLQIVSIQCIGFRRIERDRRDLVHYGERHLAELAELVHLDAQLK